MKTLKIIITIIVMASALLIGMDIHAQSFIIKDNGQIVDCSENPEAGINRDTSIDSIVEEDYPFLKNLECLENGYFTSKRNLELVFRDMDTHNDYYELSGTGDKIKVKARYASDGSLLHAILLKKDTQIPQAILRFIFSDETFKGWTITGNQQKVKDFDPYQTEYNVILSNGREKQTLHFTTRGNTIAYLGK